jgi:hypothetical protein
MTPIKYSARLVGINNYAEWVALIEVERRGALIQEGG